MANLHCNLVVVVLDTNQPSMEYRKESNDTAAAIYTTTELPCQASRSAQLETTCIARGIHRHYHKSKKNDYYRHYQIFRASFLSDYE